MPFFTILIISFFTLAYSGRDGLPLHIFGFRLVVENGAEKKCVLSSGEPLKCLHTCAPRTEPEYWYNGATGGEQGNQTNEAEA